MSVRMYALAKELKLDSKDLVEICGKAGVQGKGSALASLTEEEVEKVKSYLANRDKQGRKPAAAGATSAADAGPVRREDYVAPGQSRGGKMPVLSGRKKSEFVEPVDEEPAPQEDEAATEAPELEEAPVAAQAETESGDEETRDDSTKRPQTTAPKPSQPGAPERRPIPVMDKPPVLSVGKRKGEESGPAKSKAPKPRVSPTAHLAPLPSPSQPPAESKKKKEPAAQKPVMKLPAEALREGKSGGARPLAAHLRRAEESLETKKGKGKDAKRAKAPGEVETSARGRRGRGKGDDDSLLGREERQRVRKERARLAGDDEAGGRRLQPRKKNKNIRPPVQPRKGNIVLTLPCTVRSFSEAAGVPARVISQILLREEVPLTAASVSSQLDPEMAEYVAAELGVTVEFRQPVSLEDQLLKAIEDREDDPKDLVPRPPVITFLGHVDHGKTSLLDKIIGSDVVSGESGGITQHIRAYQIDKDGQKISFVDTPGHEAFTEMRARGANVTDIAVLVVAADDGVMPQTEEAISHAKAAEVPIVVAMNKIDLPGVDPNRVLQELSTNDLLPSEWGGDVEVVRTSAITGDGIDELLDTLLTVAELHEYKANPSRPAYGTCLEAQQEPGRGVIAKLIVQAGTLHVGDVIVCGQAYGKIKSMYDTLDPKLRVKEAGPTVPVNITGFDEAPAAGEHFYVLRNISQARQIADRRASVSRAESLVGTTSHVTLENLFERLGSRDEVQTLNLIIRADVRGSIEAIRNELAKLSHDEVKIRILQASVGGVTEADVHLADASDAIIVGFNVVPEEGARILADRRGVQIRRYDIIYKLTEDIKAALEGMLKPMEQEVELGRALVQQTFAISRTGTVAGCRVLAGTIERNCRIRVARNNKVIGDYALGSLRRVKDDVREVREGMECGIKLDGFNDLKEGDILEAYKIEEVERKLEDMAMMAAT